MSTILLKHLSQNGTFLVVTTRVCHSLCKATNEGAALAMAIPVHTQSRTLIFIGHGNGGHRVFELGQGWVIGGLSTTSVIAFIQGARLDFGEGSCTQCCFSMMRVIAK